MHQLVFWQLHRGESAGHFKSGRREQAAGQGHPPLLSSKSMWSLAACGKTGPPAHAVVVGRGVEDGEVGAGQVQADALVRDLSEGVCKAAGELGLGWEVGWRVGR